MIELLAVGLTLLVFCVVVFLLVYVESLWIGLVSPPKWPSRCFRWLRDRLVLIYWYVRWWLAGGAYAR